MDMCNVNYSNPFANSVRWASTFASAGGSSHYEGM
jgi:hypothetical protein